jgi:DNA-binding MarR family transcriptional regulator
MTEEGLNTQVMDALIDVIKAVGTLGQSVGATFGLNGSCAMALFKLDEPLSMKELSQRIGCDASFVTVIADSLERLGIARREPSQRDRRVKNLVLTEHGQQVREEITRQVTGRTPWSNALDIDERKCFLGLLNKMLGRAEGGVPVTSEAVSSS